jgi:hypothetical protein
MLYPIVRPVTNEPTAHPIKRRIILVNLKPR